MADGRYVLVYHEDLIANYPQVWDDDKALATWLRLLALADKLWPSPAEMPRRVNAAALKVLTACGLIEHLPLHRFRVRGLDGQRQRRVDAAKNAAAGRWGNADGNADSNAHSNAPVSPRAMPRTDAGARPQSGLPLGNGSVSLGVGYGAGVGSDDPEWAAMVWLSERKAVVREGSGLHLKLCRLVEKHGVQAVIRTMAGLGDNLEAGQYVLGADNALNPIPAARRLTTADQKAQDIAEAKAEAQRRIAANAS